MNFDSSNSLTQMMNKFPFSWFQKYWDSIVLVWLVSILFWGKSWEVAFPMDAMTYSGLARHILSSGDWLTLHYSTQAYSDFYQHPPLVIWILAFTFKCFGVLSEAVAQLPCFIFILGTLWITVLWGRRASGTRWGGFVAGLILVLSTRYMKYSMIPMLDGFLSFWMTLGGFLLVMILDKKLKKNALGILLGLSISLGFMTKGMPILAVLGEAILIFSIQIWVCVKADQKSELKSYLRMVFLMVVFAILPLAIWWHWGGGLNYLQHYWVESVRSRLGGSHSFEFFSPTRNLLKAYWPWFPIFWIAVFVQMRGFFRADSSQDWSDQRRAISIAALSALSVLVGFSLVGNFLEQYLTPFFPFAAVVCSAWIAPRLEKKSASVVAFLFTFLLLYTFVLAVIPIEVQGDRYRDPKRRILRLTEQSCSHDSTIRLFLSSSEYSLWEGLAMGAWYTPWDTSVATPSEALLHPRGALFVGKKGLTLSGWTPTSIQEGGFQVYEKTGALLCPRMDN